LQKAIEEKVKIMIDEIVKGLRELVLSLSIILFIVGLFLFFMGLFYLVASKYELEPLRNLGEWNWYILVFGLIVFAFGAYYLYSYLKKRRFIIKELKTNKRSELLKKNSELHATVKHLPSKFKKMLLEKEAELGIK
jgi:hypothetical protein